jgi:hypothetical protein
MVADFAQRINNDARRNHSFFLKTARNRIFFAEWFASDNLNTFSFMKLMNNKKYISPLISIWRTT